LTCCGGEDIVDYLSFQFFPRGGGGGVVSVLVTLSGRGHGFGRVEMIVIDRLRFDGRDRGILCAVFLGSKVMATTANGASRLGDGTDGLVAGSGVIPDR
jgi:hypothetical protein